MLDTAETAAREKPLLLIVDDDALISETLAYALSPEFQIVTSHSRSHCLQIVRQLRSPPDLALIDLGLPPSPHRPDEGLALIADLQNLSPETRLVVLSGQGDTDNARHARSLGAQEFLEKPCRPGDILDVLQRALQYPSLESRSRTPQQASPLVGNSLPIQKLRIQLQQYADSPFPVLIEGESGSGKEIVAVSYLHRETKRRGNPFFALNCAAISPSLVEPTLFGYTKGAFTGAGQAKAGYFEDAGEGTLFLDEIGELPLELQPKLLRVLENGEYQRVGETQSRVSHARIVAATNRDLRKEVRAGNFRADLYHRLSVFSVLVPPLREMGDDRILLLDHFRHLYAEQTQLPAFSLSSEALELWRGYHFPGNVRELRNIVIRLTAKFPGQAVGRTDLENELDLPDLPVTDEQPKPADQPKQDAVFVEQATQVLRDHSDFSLDGLLSETERSYIEAALQLTNGNVSQAARLLGVNRTTLYNRMESFARSRHVS